MNMLIANRMSMLGLWLALPLLLLQAAAPVVADVNGTVAPIIGVLAQEVPKDGLISRHFNGSSYIAASYVKFVEGAGGRVVPIRIGQNRSYYEEVMQKINGVLLPGGATYFYQPNGYADAGEHLIKIAMELNDNGTVFPVWGTCLGMELMVLKMANGTETRSDCNSTNEALPLNFQPGYKQSRLFGAADKKILSIMATENVTYNFHRYCYTKESFKNEPLLNNSFRIMSLNNDINGIEFVSSIEHVTYPFYGVQFHPEKPMYEFVSPSIPHTNSAILTGQFFANFLINQARQNNHSFANLTEQMRTLIYNYKPEFTAAIGSSFIQQYLFEDVPKTREQPETFEEIPDIPEIGGDDGDDDGSSGSHYPYNGGNIGDGAATQYSISGLVVALALSVFLATVQHS